MAINIPDYDGKAVTWITNAEGTMVLDSLRAMKNDTALGLADSGIALYGYSGGGSATIHTAELRQTYAPDVRLLGAAFGAAPTNLTALLNYATSPEPGLTGTVNFGAWIGLVMWSRAYPELAHRVEELLTPEGHQILADIQHRCYATLALTGACRPINAYLKDPDTKLEALPEFANVLADNSIGHHIPDIPLLWWHGMWDELIPPSIILPTVDDYWNRGANLRFYTVPAPEHIVNAVLGWILATAWTSAILRGLPPGPTFKADYQPLPPGFPGA
ncbi:lipase family protein [Nocardia tengchongensis]|uniref:lipase family protein n=1 Tax=Nocardia tengchongensis TaxID=2055889 RepID=UPI0036B68AD5